MGLLERGVIVPTRVSERGFVYLCVNEAQCLRSIFLSTTPSSSALLCGAYLALNRISRVNDGEGGARFENAHDAHHKGRAAVCVECDAILLLNALADKKVTEAVGERLDLLWGDETHRDSELGCNLLNEQGIAQGMSC